MKLGSALSPLASAVPAIALLAATSCGAAVATPNALPTRTAAEMAPSAIGVTPSGPPISTQAPTPVLPATSQSPPPTAQTPSSGSRSRPTDITASLATCGDLSSPFTTSPIALDDFLAITPLGHLNPPAHTFPSDHVYFYLRRSGPAARPGALPPAAEVSVYSPGKITITLINSREFTGSAEPGFRPHTDFQIEFSPCRELHARFDHLASLSEFLTTAYAGSADSCTTYATGGTTVRSCSNRTSIALSDGELIGTAGGPNGSNNLDFGAWDDRVPAGKFANPSRWGPSVQHAVCPVEYFAEDVRRLLGTRFADVAGTPRTDPPVCGEVGQDIAGSATGAWFVKGTTQTYPEDPHLALVHDNFSPSVAVFSVGASMAKLGLPSGKYTYSPVHSGVVNREFDELTGDGGVYCFETRTGFGTGPVIILKLESRSTVRLERIESTVCGTGPWSFAGAAMEFER